VRTGFLRPLPPLGTGGPRGQPAHVPYRIPHGGHGLTAETFSFKCTACGKCCNSAPLTSLPELFHHESLFVGCLAIRRVKRYKPGQALVASGIHYPLSETDAGEMSALVESLYFDPGIGYDLAIQTQALDYESLNRCPALGEDNRCTIHDNRKPATCSMVPFDALFPDRLQHLVLASRDLGENCIVEGHAQEADVVIKDRQITSEEYRLALAQRRSDLLAEKQGWGDAVFALLRPALMAEPNLLQKIPVDGFLTLSIVPLLAVIGGVSERWRERTLQYVDSQINLIDLKTSQAIQRKNASDKPTTQALRGFKDAYLKFRTGLLAESRLFPTTPGQAAVLENYLSALTKHTG
jgi:Fe-S-cluster containining protein